MKKAVSLILLIGFVLASHTSFAFLYDFTILSKEEIKELADEELVNVYIEAKIELDATRSFHGEAGFTPKEYNRHKKLLGYIIMLRLEMQIRELEVPPIEDWIR